MSQVAILLIPQRPAAGGYTKDSLRSQSLKKASKPFLFFDQTESQAFFVRSALGGVFVELNEFETDILPNSVCTFADGNETSRMG